MAIWSSIFAIGVIAADADQEAFGAIHEIELCLA